jgi:hypothetical protein
MLIKKSQEQPVLKKTARGGRKMARRYMQTSYCRCVSYGREIFEVGKIEEARLRCSLV